MNFKYTSKNTYSCKKNNKSVEVVATPKIFNNLDETAINQLLSITEIDSVYEKVIGLPDMHVGYGVPIGSCFATDYEKGIISSEAVGYDINCGVRLITTNLTKKDLCEKDLHKITKSLETLPLGLSNKGVSLTKKEFNDILLTGVNWAIDNNYFSKKQKQRVEENGVYKNAKIDYLSKEATKRGIQQVGTLGQGNHFVDLLLVEDVFSEKYAKKLNLFKDQYCVMLHSGSRGFGHQIAKDFTTKFTNKKPFAYEDFHSKIGQQYYYSMLCAANFAFVNRTILSKLIEEKIKSSFVNNKDLSFSLMYDLCHNIAKIEKHKSKKLIVHRKGATRVYSKEDVKKNSCYSSIGNPVILPGSMKHKSYVLLPNSKKQLEKTFCTVAHGSGRQLSRTKAKEKISIEELQKQMTKNKIILSGKTQTLMREEQPAAYKPSNEVVNSLVDKKLLNKVVSLKPKIVITG
jgi:tRNA-splicing ligase RtcB (3'-phosphate/5'-hydroxy nucleic acid ligase)